MHRDTDEHMDTQKCVFVCEKDYANPTEEGVHK